jgi:hypothetical protein
VQAPEQRILGVLGVDQDAAALDLGGPRADEA